MRNWLLPLLAFAWILYSCNDTIPIGTEILPGSDIPGNFFTDTTTIFSWTVSEDSLRSDRLFTSRLGYTEDPIFGATSASLMMGFRIPNSVINSSALQDTVGGYYLDSAVLVLMLNGIYGDSTIPMGFTLYKLPSPLNTSQPYFSNRSLPQGMVQVGRIDSYTPSLARDYSEDTTFSELAPQMRLKLNPFFGQSMLNILNTDQINSNDLFKSYLPGLVVIPDQTPGSILGIDMLTNASTTTTRTSLEDSRLHIYFKNAVDTSLSVIFPATILDLGINTFTHDYSSTNVETALASSIDQGDAVNYIQGMAGVKTRIEFPYLDEFAPSTAIIKAELVVTQLLDGNEATFPPPSRLYALLIDEEDKGVNITDFTTLPAAHFDGNGREVTLDNGDMVIQYRLNISDYLQSVIKGQLPNDGMYIAVNPEQDLGVTSLNTSVLVPNRLVLGGGTNTDDEYKLHLEMTYTVLE